MWIEKIVHRTNLHNRLSLFVMVNVCAILIEGIAVVILLFNEPSEPDSAPILGFSIQRWGLLLFNLLLIVVMFYLARVWNTRAESFSALDRWVIKHVLSLLLILVTLAIITAASLLPVLSLLQRLNFYNRLLPAVIWFELWVWQAFLTFILFFSASIRISFESYAPLDLSPERYPFGKNHTPFFLGLAIIYLTLQIYQHLVIRNANWVADSIDYILPARNLTVATLFSWTYAKPWGAAVLYYLTGTLPQNIDIFQALISAIAWISLAWVFSRSIQIPLLKVISFTVILGFSLSDQVQMWNHVILSESLSISLMILAIALWLSLVQRWSWAVLAALLFTLFYWINTREANLYLCLLIAAGIFLIGLIKRNQRFYWLVSYIVVIASLFTLWNSERLTMPRWAFSLTNVILQRILPEPEYVDFFVNHGMPVTPELEMLEGQWAYSNDFAVFNNSALNHFERWLYAEGKTAYALFLLTHPKYALLSPLTNLASLMAEPDLVKTYAPNYRQLFPNLIDNLLFPIWWFEIYAWLCLALIAGVIFIKPPRFTRTFWLVGVLVILWLPYNFLIWHADAMEIARHAIQANIQFRLSMWMLALLVADVLSPRFMDRRDQSEISPLPGVDDHANAWLLEKDSAGGKG